MTLWLAFHKNEPLSLDSFLQLRWPEIIKNLPSNDTLVLTELLSDSRPAELSSVDQMMAHYQNFDRVELQNLLRFSRTCLPGLPSPQGQDLQKAWLWINFTCGLKKFPNLFFKKPPFLFPSGQSYVQLAEDLKFDFSGYLTSEEIKSLKSISEILAISPMGHDLNLQQISGLINGEDLLLGENFIYLKLANHSESSKGRIYARVPQSKWNEIMESEYFIFTDLFSQNCQQVLSNGCWIAHRKAEEVNQVFYLTLILILDAGVFITGLVFFMIDRRRRQKLKENQRFNLQMLTHELRTPVTTLGIQLENIRVDFDQLSSQQQINFLKMSQEVQRLKNSMQMSYAYLQTDAVSENKLKINLETVEINSFLKSFADENLTLVIPEQKIQILAERNWLQLCLRNLIKNAQEHGQPPVQITLTVVGTDTLIEVSDQGTIQQTHLDSLTSPFQKSESSHGLGLGLSIIRQVLTVMQGQMLIQRNPTRFTLLFRRAR